MVQVQNNKEKKKILCFIDWFLPGFKAGGQIPSFANMVNLLKTEYSFFIITSNCDLGEKEPYEEITSDEWMDIFNAKIKYLSYSNRNYKTMKNAVEEIQPDIIYLSSLFSLKFTLLPLFINKLSKEKTKIILGPRGMLGDGALKQKSLKKNIFLQSAKLLGIYNRITWHASSIQEKVEIENIFGKDIPIKIALDIASIPRINLGIKQKKKENQAKLFFLSRISRKKNLKFAIQILNRINKKYTINLSIIGPIEDTTYWKECLNEIEHISSNINIVHNGFIPNNEINENLTRHYEFFIFPTLHENFGHVVAESMFAGCPVIISDQTPWRSLEQKGIGWDIPLVNSERFVEVIEYCAAMGQEEFDAMSQRAFAYAKQITEDPEVLEANRRLFEI